MSSLLALLDGQEVGTLSHEKGRLSFTYTERWRSASQAYPLSLSMPLASAHHRHSAVAHFLWGLLPDNEFVLARWARQFHVSARNPFALLAVVGEDCAGAVQFIRPERALDYLSATPVSVDWLTEADVARRLRALRTDVSAWRTASDVGQFSLAGAQPKTALLFDGQRWGVPSGRMPTTHILKPAADAFDGHAENEHLCLTLARALGLPTATSQVMQFEDVTAIIVERYDRVRIADMAAAQAAMAAAAAANAMTEEGEVGAAAAEVAQHAAQAQMFAEFAKSTPIFRVHQEDFCQALSVHPAHKYQNEGGPSAKNIVELIRNRVSSGRQEKGAPPLAAAEEDETTFLDALIFNWLIGGTDGHAKNYSLLIGGGGVVRLAPLYDIASIYAYDNVDPERAKMAMSIGDIYRLEDIGARAWQKLATAIGRDPDALILRARTLAERLPDTLADKIKELRTSGLAHRAIEALGRRLPIRAARLSRL